MGNPLRQRWVQAGSTLLNRPKVESRGVGDRLDVVVRGEVVVGSWNCGMLPHSQTRDCLWKRVTEVGVLRATAVPSPPTGVHGKLHEVGESSDLLGAAGLTARQRTKLI